MKNYTLSLCAAAAALVTLPSTSFAQDKPAGDPPAHAGRWARSSPEERLKQMTQSLDLTQDQQDKIKAITEKNAAAIKELRDKGFQNLTDEDKTKMRELMTKQFEEIKTVLTAEQQAKQQAEMEKRRGAGHQNVQPTPEPAK